MLFGRPYLRDGVPDMDVKDGGLRVCCSVLLAKKTALCCGVRHLGQSGLKRKGEKTCLAQTIFQR